MSFKQREIFRMYMRRGHMSLGIESQDRTSRSNFHAKMCVLDEYLLRRPMSIDWRP